MKTVLNVIWFICFGLVFSAIHLVLSGVLLISIVGIPAGKALFEIARLEAFPFGKTVEYSDAEPSIPNVLWGSIAGPTISLIYLVMSLFLCATIILVPFAKQCVKIAKFAYSPFGSNVYEHDMLRQSNHASI